MNTTNETADRITHEEAHEIAKRYNCSHWRSEGEKARYTIPADPRRDDDLRLRAYIKQNEARDAELARVKAQADRAAAIEIACKTALEQFEYFQSLGIDLERIYVGMSSEVNSRCEELRTALSQTGGQK